MGPTNFFIYQFCLFTLFFWKSEGQIRASNINKLIVNVKNGDAIKNTSRENLFLDYMVSLFKGKPFVDFESEKKIANPADRISDYTQYSAVRLGLSELTNVPKLIPEFGPVYNDILSFRYYSDNDQLWTATCSGLEPLPKGSVLFAIISLSEPAQRDEFRQDFWQLISDFRSPEGRVTVDWYKDFKRRVGPMYTRHLFFVVKPKNSDRLAEIEKESKFHQDIVLIDMEDFAENSTLRLAAVLNYIRHICEIPETIAIATDDDWKLKFNRKTFEKMAALMTSKELVEDHFFGIGGDRYPLRTKGEKQITLERFPWKEFPNYPAGSSFYFFKEKMIVPLLAAFQTTPMLPMDDVYLGISLLKAGYDFYDCGACIQKCL